jgi:hypothetical protein
MNKKSFGLFWRVYTTDIVWSLAIEFVSSPFKETNSLTTSASRSSANLCKNYKKQYFIYFTYMIKNKYFSFSFMSAILTLVIWNILDNTFNAKSNWLYMIGVYCWTEILTIDHLHFFIRTDINLYYPGRTCTIVNDRLRRKTEIYRDRARLPYTTRVHGVIRWETDSVYGDRTKMLSD